MELLTGYAAIVHITLSYGFKALMSVVLILLGLGFWLCPSICAHYSGHKYKYTILAVNVTIGWHPIIWVPLFFWTLFDDRFHTK